MRVVSILDIALWDLKARKAGLPLYRLLGGKMQRLPVLVPCGYRREKNDEGLQAEVASHRASGVTAMKTMFTPRHLEARAEDVNEAREIAGTEVIFGNDFYATGSSAPEVSRALSSVAEAKLDFVEDPFALSAREEFVSFRRDWRGLLVTGETVSSLTAAEALCHSGWINAARFDATVCGGVTAWMQMRAMAAAQRQPVWPHCFPEIHAHLAAATGEPFVESSLPGYETINFGAVLKSPLPIAGGYYELPSRAGLGLDLDLEMLGALRVKDL
jgi:L-alanine-DL-glutamate epimerase-like enolase superfamily enzyme